MPLFHHLYPKIDLNTHFNSVLLDYWVVNNNKKKGNNRMLVSIIKIRISIMFMHILSKLISEICQKIEGLNGKTEQNRLKVPTLPTFVQKINVFFSRFFIV